MRFIVIPRKKYSWRLQSRVIRRLLFDCYYTECREGRYSFSWIAPLHPRPLPYKAECYAKRLQVPFLSLWYVSTWEWTQVFLTIGEKMVLTPQQRITPSILWTPTKRCAINWRKAFQPKTIPKLIRNQFTASYKKRNVNAGITLRWRSDAPKN